MLILDTWFQGLARFLNTHPHPNTDIQRSPPLTAMTSDKIIVRRICTTAELTTHPESPL